MDANELIITAQPEAAVIALNEIQKLDPGARPLCALNPEARLISLPGGYTALREALRTSRIIFVRHMFPVQMMADPDRFDPDVLLPAAAVAGGVDQRPFSVQMRCDDDFRIHKHARALSIVRDIETRLCEHGFAANDKNPAWVVSLFFKEDKLYAGVSDCTDNRSAWNGGAMRFKKDDSFVGRAEFKLLEAYATFGIKAPEGSPRALDLGAAPGGWSKVLLEAGYRVTAVDPAAMAETLAGHPKLTHVRATAQRYSHDGELFSLITNDMRMDIGESCRVMLAFYDRLKPEGEAVMTLKLTPGHWYQKTIKALAQLEKKYRVLDARQLFHNRDEVTLYLRSST